MTHKTGTSTVNGNALKTSATAQEEDVLTLIQEMSAMVGRLSEELRAMREDVADLREGQAPA
ncbi:MULTISPECIES: hypothetical protein [Streptomyces]|uniref:hypothetical protein n=1 Tax=Streptomyces TaxID=1883 RepID=UPI002E2C7124|nr:hypothetical protein [Streptomyces caniferus]WSW52988.1 hypothetical protein OG962_17050 [Streptomyces platensis]